MLILPSLIESTDAAAGTSTVYGLTVGQTAQGVIASGDHDWYSVQLVAGQTYTFAQVGTGVSSLRDTFLRLRDSNGAVIASDDDNGPDLSSLITFTASATGTFYLDGAGYAASDTGQYGISATLGTGADLDIPMGAGAIDGDASWSTRGTAATVSYGFRQSAATYTVPGSDLSTFSHATVAQMAALDTILQLWADVSRLSFVPVNRGGYTDQATVLIGNYSDPDDGAGAFAYYPGSTSSSSAAGDVWLNLNSISTTSLPFGSYSFFAIMHEIGHAIGLSHPGDYNAAPGVSITYANSAQFVQDSQQYSVMSYFAGSNTGQTPGRFSSAYTPMMLDIYELQKIYGVNTTTRVGDTTYGFGSNAGSAFAFSGSGSAAQFCIWDAGGGDTLNCSGFSQSQLISLGEGTFSDIGGATANISIALGALIENGIGGWGADTIIGNRADNLLRGGAGDDTLDGGDGLDSAEFEGLRSAYQVTPIGGAGVQVVGPDGTDTLRNIERLIFQDQIITWSPGETALQFQEPSLKLAAFGPNAGGWWSDDSYHRELADVNGDGMADIVGFASAGAIVALATGGGRFGGSQFKLGAFGAGFEGGGWNSDDRYHREVADVNGDGMADIVAFASAGVIVSLATGGGAFGGSQFKLGAFGAGPEGGGWWSDDRYPRQLADVNGDGMADIVGFADAGVCVSLATGGGNFGGVTLALPAFGPSAGGWSSNDRYTRQLADVNGDGMADIVGFADAGVCVSLATGGGSFGGVSLVLSAFGPSAGGWTSDDLFHRELADVNGDGRIDIVGFGDAGVSLALGNGDGTFASESPDLVAFGPSSGGWNSQTSFPRHLADIDGDGAADVVGFGDTGVMVSLSNGFDLI